MNTINVIVIAVSDLLDEANSGYPVALLRRVRCSKLQEEVGEVEDAIVGIEGSNPRKGIYATEQDLANELLDVATTALYAYYHVTKDPNVTEALRIHLLAQAERIGVKVPQDDYLGQHEGPWT